MAQWSAFGAVADGFLICELNGATFLSTKLFSTLDAARAAAHERQVHIGGQSEAVPAKVLPDTGNLFNDLTQEAPIGRLGGWSRLWVAGFLSTRPNWDGVVCIVEDDITHWVHLSADEVVSFQSFITGRLIKALGGSETSDVTAIADSMSRPERLATQLRSAELAGLSESITGYLVGAELAAARPYWLGQNVAVIAESPLYSDALSMQGVMAQVVSNGDMQRAGLAALAQKAGLAN